MCPPRLSAQTARPRNRTRPTTQPQVPGHASGEPDFVFLRRATSSAHNDGVLGVGPRRDGDRRNAPGTECPHTLGPQPHQGPPSPPVRLYCVCPHSTAGHAANRTARTCRWSGVSGDLVDAPCGTLTPLTTHPPRPVQLSGAEGLLHDQVTGCRGVQAGGAARPLISGRHLDLSQALLNGSGDRPRIVSAEQGSAGRRHAPITAPLCQAWAVD
jgi:hypothetical protein